ncbi:methyl-accepting chemotaxis protein [Melittangium boletus]|uniref:methyl-accepting chemotaxis protein n=1 Tax=Melittangium boletus TaxID=83453 RepID=UPI0012FD6DAD|nr:methyl-accepting chemotaxis protein [Melittangium boletus]
MKRLVLKGFLEQQLSMLTALLPVVYMLSLVMGLPAEQAVHVSLINVAFNSPIFGIFIPVVLVYSVMKGALEHRPRDKPGDRLARILKAPRKIEYGVLVSYAVSCTIWAGWPTLVYGLDPVIIPQAVTCFVLLAMVVGIRLALRLERLLRPYALEEFHKHPHLRLQGQGILWPKQHWYLPYCFALLVFSALTVTGIIILKKSGTGFGALFLEVEKVAPALVGMLRERVGVILSDMVLPVVAVGGFLIGAAAWCAWEIARHQSQGTIAVQKSIESIASRKPALPEWVSTDEVGDLSIATASAFERLRTFSASLQESAMMLGGSAGRLNTTHQEQTESLSIQAAALQETQVTAQEIKQTSLVAAQKAEEVLRQAERADSIGRAGEAALEQSLTDMQGIQREVAQMAQSIRSLDEQAKQIANITTTVKSLADRSTMLALNAAIEAVRSGEHGKGFAVVAREIRSLADQSIKATHNVQNILQDLSSAIRATADRSESGSSRVLDSAKQLRAFGDNIRQLSSIVRDNVNSVRQISAAVTQQNQGIGQIFQAVNSLTEVMDQTMASLRTSDEAAEQMRHVASRVSSAVWEQDWNAEGGQRAIVPPPLPKPKAS